MVRCLVHDRRARYPSVSPCQSTATPGSALLNNSLTDGSVVPETKELTLEQLTKVFSKMTVREHASLGLKQAKAFLTFRWSEIPSPFMYEDTDVPMTTYGNGRN